VICRMGDMRCFNARGEACSLKLHRHAARRRVNINDVSLHKVDRCSHGCCLTKPWRMFCHLDALLTPSNHRLSMNGMVRVPTSAW
jgi:hypothetical protein